MLDGSNQNNVLAERRAQRQLEDRGAARVEDVGALQHDGSAPRPVAPAQTMLKGRRVVEVAPEDIIHRVGQHNAARALGVRRANERVVPSFPVKGLRRVAEVVRSDAFWWLLDDGVVRAAREGRQRSVISDSFALRVPEFPIGARVQRDDITTALVHRARPGPTFFIRRRFGQNWTHKFPVDQVGRRGVAPHNMAPGRVVFVVLEEQMIFSIVEDGPVRVVEPPLLRSYMIFGLLFVVQLAGVYFIMLFE